MAQKRNGNRMMQGGRCVKPLLLTLQKCWVPFISAFLLELVGMRFYVYQQVILNYGFAMTVSIVMALNAIYSKNCCWTKVFGVKTSVCDISYVLWYSDCVVVGSLSGKCKEKHEGCCTQPLMEFVSFTFYSFSVLGTSYSRAHSWLREVYELEEVQNRQFVLSVK